MAKITVFTAARMAAIEAASIVSGVINGSGHLILSRNDGTTIDAGYMLASVPAASSTVAGIIELADTTEATTGTATDRAMTPANVSSVVTAKTASGAETLAGAISNKFVTPLGLLSRVASTTLTGLVRLATTTEAATGTATDIAVTPAGLAGLVGTGGPGYRYGGTVVFTTASSTFTKATYPGLRAVLVKCQGSGGGGGGAQGSIVSGNHSSGSGGGAGGYAEKLILASALAASETVTVPNAGVGVSGANGTAGGTCAFGAFVSATGGDPGTFGTTTALSTAPAGGSGGTGVGGDFVATGQPGAFGQGNATLGFGGQGGSSRFGGGGPSTYTGSNAGSLVGENASGWGAGGGGATNNQNATTAKAGGNGTRGIILVDLLY